jgi:nucleotidyltransferase substrate binding protein (TIGR01987 family)
MTLDTPPETSDRRWLQRFDNLERALKQLAAAIDAHQTMPENELMVIAMIKAYAFCFELGWKTLKDLLAWNGIDARLPREVLKQAFAAGLIENGQRWIDMLEERNLLVHPYDQARALLAAERISQHFWPELIALQRTLNNRRSALKAEGAPP